MRGVGVGDDGCSDGAGMVDETSIGVPVAGAPAPGAAGTAAPRPRATSLDVARRAGVHQSTVSRALGSGGSVAAATRARVEAAARELNYTPDAIARSLITRRTALVGILVAGLSSPFQPYVLEKFVHRLSEARLRPLVFSVPPGQEVDDLLATALEYRPDALIITSAGLASDRVEECVRQGTPVVLFNRTSPGSSASVVCCDNVAGGRMAADVLLAGGGRRFAYLAGSADSSTNRDRRAGFLGRLRERGVADILEEEGSYAYEAGYVATQRLLSRAARDRPDALFCASDILGLGARDAARDEGVRVPDELAIVGFDDIPMAAWSPYDLTTIRQPVDRMIEETLALVREGSRAPVIRLFPGELVERGSTRRGDRTPAVH